MLAPSYTLRFPQTGLTPHRLAKQDWQRIRVAWRCAFLNSASASTSFLTLGGEAICLHNVQLHKGEFYGTVHVIIARNNVNGELWAIVSNEKTTLQTFAEYGLRFDIEENFLDDQSAGWNVQPSMIRDVCALSRLS